MTFATELETATRRFIASGDGRPLERRRAVRLLRFLEQPDSEFKQRILRRMERHALTAIDDMRAEGEVTATELASSATGAVDWSTVFKILRVFLSLLGLLLIFI